MAKGKHQASGLSVYLRLLRYVIPYWPQFSLSIFGFALFSSSQPMLATLAGWLADAIYTRDPASIYLIPLTLMAIYLLRGIGGFLGNYLLAKVSFAIVRNLRNELFKKLLILPNRFYENNNSGHLISLITFNVTQVTEAATNAVKVLIREGIAVLALTVYIVYLNWQLTLIFLAVTPVIALVVSYASKRFKKLSSKIQVSMGDLTHVTSEAISGYKEVKSFGGQAYERERFQAACHNNFLQNLKMVKTTAINIPLLQMIVAIALACLVFVALSFMGEMDPAAFITYITAAGLLPKPIRQLSAINASIQKGIAAAESLFELLDEQQEQDRGSLISTRVQGKLAFKNLSFQYPQASKKVIEDFTLTIEPGQRVALVGYSGSGKSTLANLTTRFYDYQQGEISLDDTPLKQYSLASLRQQIAMVTQDPILFNDSIFNNIAYGSLHQHTRERVIQAAKLAHAMEFITPMEKGLDTLVGEDGILLSGGQRQRLAIARALLKNAPILILDEATSALDTESERIIQDALENVMQGRTTLIIAHRLSTIETADIIVVMDKGKIVEQGCHSALLAQGGFYYELHNRQFSEPKVS